MAKEAAITLVVLLEVILILVALLGFAFWRLRAARNQAAPMSPTDAGRLWLDESLRQHAGRAGSLGPAAARRHGQLQAERQALDVELPEERDAVLRAAYDGTATTETDRQEAERLRRLLQREEARLAKLLTLRDELKELRVRYDRVRRLAERLAEDNVGEGQREQVAGTYQKLEAEWTSRLGSLEERFGEATADIELPAESDSAELPVDDTGAPATASQNALARQTEILQRLRERLGDDADAVAEIDRLGEQVGELETAITTRESENRRLAERIVAFGEGAASLSEMEQALAMKDREILELRAELASREPG
jgi:hypothetical protein